MRKAFRALLVAIPILAVVVLTITAIVLVNRPTKPAAPIATPSSSPTQSFTDCSRGNPMGQIQPAPASPPAKQPTGTALAVAGWKAAPAAEPGQTVLDNYLMSAARYLLESYSVDEYQSDIKADLAHCKRQLAPIYGVGHVQDQPLQAWTRAGRTAYTLGDTGPVAFLLVAFKADSEHRTYLVVPHQPETPETLARLNLGQPDDDSSIPSGYARVQKVNNRAYTIIAKVDGRESSPLRGEN